MSGTPDFQARACPACGSPAHLGAAPASSPVLSVVVPVFNEAEVLPELSRRLLAVLGALDISAEVIFVDDGSTDATPAVLSLMRSAHDALGIIRLSRNFGKELALSAGLHACAGECVIVIDADLQDPPELIPMMVEAWRAGDDVVNMRRRSRGGETWFKKLSARWFYRTLNRLSDTPIPADVGDFRLLSRRAVQAVNALPETNRYMKGLFAWVGFRQVTLDYDRAPRAAGVAKQNYGRLFALATEGITSFSVVPLRVALMGGLAAAASAFGMTVYFIGKTLIFGDPVTGFPTLIVTILTLGGLNLLGLGVLGEYVGRLFMEAKRRPLYLVDAFAEPLVRSRTAASAGTANPP
jgi:glycosyltransferase involved in cell wall biosynthesis